MYQTLSDVRNHYNEKIIKSIPKNGKHQEPIGGPDNSYLSKAYSLTSIVGAVLNNPDRAKVTVTSAHGNFLDLDKQFDIPVAHSQPGQEYPDCEIISLHIRPNKKSDSITHPSVLYSLQFNPFYKIPENGESTYCTYAEDYTRNNPHPPQLSTETISSSPTHKSKTIPSTSRETLEQPTCHTITPTVLNVTKSANYPMTMTKMTTAMDLTVLSHHPLGHNQYKFPLNCQHARYPLTQPHHQEKCTPQSHHPQEPKMKNPLSPNPQQCPKPPHQLKQKPPNQIPTQKNNTS